MSRLAGVLAWSLPFVVIVSCVAFALRRTRWSKTALRVSRWTYVVVMPLSLLYFPLKAGGFRPIRCQWAFDVSLALDSLRNWQHEVLCATLFVVTVLQLPNVKRAFAWAFAAVFVLGFLTEIAQGATGVHNCRMRDLIPDMAGACIGAIVVAGTRKLRSA